jgi:hypothetical protein
VEKWARAQRCPLFHSPESKFLMCCATSDGYQNEITEKCLRNHEYSSYSINNIC